MKLLDLVRKWTLGDTRGSWWGLTVREPYTGAWQRNVEWTTDTVLAYHAVYACITLIASDIGKLRPKLVEQDDDGVWTETKSSAFSPVLRRPNHFQNHIQWKEWWATSLLIRGNTYELIERDNRSVPKAFYPMDPARVKPLVAPDGSVFYDLSQDNLSGIPGDVQVPASEIVHDRINCLFHPLVGTSPIFACGTAATVGLNIQNSSAHFHGNDATPAGILTAPGLIKQEEAELMSARWKANYGGTNSGRVAVLGNGLTFEQLRMSAVDAQIIEHLKWTAETVCSVFHVPPFKVGIGQMPTYSNGEILDGRYYSDCLQSLIEHMEVLLDDALGIGEGNPKEGRTLGVELDLDGLLRMDTQTQVTTLSAGVQGSIFTTNEARRRFDLPAVDGGDSIRSQQQYFDIAALEKRDQDEPFAKPLTAATAPLALPPGKEEPEDEEKAFDLAGFLKSVSDYEASCLVT